MSNALITVRPVNPFAAQRQALRRLVMLTNDRMVVGSRDEIATHLVNYCGSLVDLLEPRCVQHMTIGLKPDGLASAGVPDLGDDAIMIYDAWHYKRVLRAPTPAAIEACMNGKLDLIESVAGYGA